MGGVRGLLVGTRSMGRGSTPQAFVLPMAVDGLRATSPPPNKEGMQDMNYSLIFLGLSRTP